MQPSEWLAGCQEFLSLKGKLETRPGPLEMDVALKAAFSLQPGRQMPAPVAETGLEGASGKLWPQVDRE